MAVEVVHMNPDDNDDLQASFDACKNMTFTMNYVDKNHIIHVIHSGVRQTKQDRLASILKKDLRPKDKALMILVDLGGFSLKHAHIVLKDICKRHVARMMVYKFLFHTSLALAFREDESACIWNDVVRLINGGVDERDS